MDITRTNVVLNKNMIGQSQTLSLPISQKWTKLETHVSPLENLSSFVADGFHEKLFLNALCKNHKSSMLPLLW